MQNPEMQRQYPDTSRMGLAWVLDPGITIEGTLVRAFHGMDLTIPRLHLTTFPHLARNSRLDLTDNLELRAMTEIMTAPLEYGSFVIVPSKNDLEM